MVWSPEYLCYTLRFSLSKGAEGRYTLSYNIDSDPLLQLLDQNGGSVGSVSEVKLSEGSPAVYLIPSMSSSAQHTIHLTFTREGVSRSYDVQLPGTNQNQIGVRIDASKGNASTMVILTSLMGSSSLNYKVSFYLDNSPLQDIKYLGNTFGGVIDLDFTQSTSYAFELPYIIPGQHTLRVDVYSERGSETSTVVFIEPERKRTELSFSYNPYTGYLMVSSSYNPLKTSFNITMDMTVKGKVTYRHDLFFGVADPTTEYFTQSGESSITIIPGLIAQHIDSGVLKSLMDKVYGNARTDASNAIGNGNRRTVYSDIYAIELKCTISSTGALAGQTAVDIKPAYREDFNIEYTYPYDTWSHSKGYVLTLHPVMTVNGREPSTIHQL